MKESHHHARSGETIVEKVRERYGRIAEGSQGGCCGTSGDAVDVSSLSRSVGYGSADLDTAPAGANLGLGCGAPIDWLGLAPGETVLDLGAGGGLDAFLAAQQVGPRGKVIGVDMTPEMIDRARSNAIRAGFAHVEFRLGRLEALPVDDASVDAVTSNCVVNLVPDKAAVFQEVMRVLRPGGRLVISDIVLDGRLPATVEQDVMAWVGCVAGAIQRADYFDIIGATGLRDVQILKDIDYLAATGCAGLPEETQRAMAEEGLSAKDLAGKVRSITLRAVKP